MKQPPFTSSISVTDGTLSEYGNHIVRHLSAMNRQNLVGQAYAATAIALPLFNKPSTGDRPRRFVKVGHSQGWTDRINQMVESVKTCILFIYILKEDPMRNDALMAAMPLGIIIINATGMGKDLPGSPITGQELIQMNRVAWEATLLYLPGAQTERDAQGTRRRRLVVVFARLDSVFAQVYHQEIAGERFDRLAAIAGETTR